jgi:hypothetical protein
MDVRWQSKDVIAYHYYKSHYELTKATQLRCQLLGNPVNNPSGIYYDPDRENKV